MTTWRATRAQVGLVLFVLAAVATWATGCGCDDGSLRITTSSLRNAIVGSEYRFQLETDGSGDLFWGFESGRLPPGIGISQEGELHGVPTAPGEFTFTVRVVSDEGANGQAELRLTVEGEESGLRLTTGSLPDGQVGEAYSFRLEAEGGQAPYSFGLAAGTLPPGLSLSQLGLISGTPADGTDTTLTVRIFDAAGGTGTDQVDLVVRGSNGAPVFVTDLLPEGREGEPYRFQLEGEGGMAPLGFRAVGQPPDGLTLSEQGLLSGAPEVGGLYEVTLEVFDQADRSTRREFYLPVEPAELRFVTEALPVGRVGEAYTASLEADGGMPPYSWVIESGELPEGLSLDDGGLISGVPTEGVSKIIGFRLIDSEGRTQPRELRLPVAFTEQIEPGIDLPDRCEVVGSESVAAEIDVQTLGMVVEVDVGVSIQYDDTAYLRVALESPTGKRVLLFSGEDLGGLGAEDLEAFYDVEDPSVGSLDLLRGEPTRGVWRLEVTVMEDPFDCAGGGSIDRFLLAIATEPSSDDYLTIEGWEANNLIQVPWVRIQGGGLPQHSIDFEVRRFTTGDNGIAEGGTGDDVDTGDIALEWSTSVVPVVGTIDDEGVFEAGSETGEGTVTGANDELEYEFVVKVVPPDWVP